MGRGNGQYFERMQAKEINLKEIFDVIKRRLWIIIVIIVAAIMGAYFYSNNMDNTLLYQSSTRVIVGSEGESMSTLMVMIKDPIVMEQVIKELELSASADALANQIEVQQLDESQIIKISATTTDSELAAAIANTTARSYKTQIASILDFQDVQLLSAAIENPYPINSKNENRLLLIAAAFGLATGIGLTFLLDSLDGKVRKERELEEILGVPVLGMVSNMNKKKLAVKKSKQKKKVEIRGEAVDI